MSLKRLRVGVIGAGSIANNIHLPCLSALDNCELAWICDLSVEKGRKAAETWGVGRYDTSYVELLKSDRPDAVFVLVQPDQIFRIARDCMAAGCHVFTEKPLGITVYQAESLARLAREKDVQCQVGFNRRFIPLIRDVIQRMKALGPIHQVDGWFYKHGEAAFYQGCASAFTCDAVHTIDLVRFIAGSEAAKTAQFSARYGDSSVDNAWNALIAFENGVTGTIHANYATGGRVHGFAVHGSSASAYINIGFGEAACSAHILHNVSGSFSMASGGAGRQRVEVLDGRLIAGSDRYTHYYGYFLEDQLFVDAILNGGAVPCGLEDALGTMRLLEKMGGSEIRIPVV